MAKPQSKYEWSVSWVLWEYGRPCFTNTTGPLSNPRYAKNKRYWKKQLSKVRRRDSKAILQREYNQALIDMEAQRWEELMYWEEI